MIRVVLPAHPRNLARDAHFDLHIPPEVFDEVSAELGLALDYFKVPKREKDEALAAFNAQKPDVTAGSMTKAGR